MRLAATRSSISWASTGPAEESFASDMGSPSVHLEAGRLHDRNPYLHFAREQFCKVFWCSAIRIEADPMERGDDLRRLEAVVERGVEALHRVAGRAVRRPKAVVGERLNVRHAALGHGRHVGQ